jgi:hypothetical protein
MAEFLAIPPEAFVKADKAKAWEEELYPSIVKMQAEKAESMVPPDWEEDPRTLESAFYHKSMKRMRGER